MSENATAETTVDESVDTPAPIPTPKDVAEQHTPPADAPKTEIWQDPEAARREIEKLRKENGDARIQAKAQAAEQARQDAISAFAKAMGIDIPGDEKPTVEGLTEKLNAVGTEAEQARAALKQSQIELAILKEASKQKVDIDRLINSRSFYENVTSFDPTAEDFATAVQVAIEAEVEKDRTLKATGGPAKSGAETYGGTGDQQAITKEQFEAMSLDEKTQLFRTNRAEFDRLANA